MAAPTACFPQLCDSSFSSVARRRPLVDRQLPGYRSGKNLRAPVLSLSSLSPNGCVNLSCSWRTNGTKASNFSRSRGFSTSQRKESRCGRNFGIWRTNSLRGSLPDWAELVPVQTSTVKEVVELKGSHSDEVTTPALSVCRCPMCGRRGLVAALIGGLATSRAQKAAGASNIKLDEYNKIIEAFHPSRGAWYEEFYARQMGAGMDSYEAVVASYKRELFEKLNESVENILELGVGTGPNLKYYGNRPHIQKVIGVDPNVQMAKFCFSAAEKAGLSGSQFEFIHGVGEIIPLLDASVDAVVCTLVLCSVNDVSSTLKEVKRVLKPGGSFLFLEHVAAPGGNSLRLWQKVLDPLQQFLADGCHLTRDTLDDIGSAKFESVEAKRFTLPGLFVIGPHIAGVACTPRENFSE